MNSELPTNNLFSKEQLENALILIGAGSISEDRFRSFLQEDSEIIAADGGVNKLKEWGIIPDRVFGDMDSIEDRGFWEEKTKVIEIEEQDTTDLEKCLYSTDAELYLAFGFTGSRFDHSLYTLHVLEKYKDKNIIFITDEEAIFKIQDEWSAKLPIGTRISFIPLEETTNIKSQGLKYPLDGIKLKIGEMVSTSNEVSEENVSVQLEKGSNLIGILAI